MPVPITPKVATDIIIEMQDHLEHPIVLVERKYEPYGWCIPGGFVEVGERVEDAAVREALEETSLHVKLYHLLGVYSDPKRDPRLHCVSIVYIAKAKGIPIAADDAKNTRLCLPHQWPELLAFDHKQILEDYVRYRAQNKEL